MTILRTSARPGSRAGGFTLIELLVVLVVIALATSLVAPYLLDMVSPDPAHDLPSQLQDRIDRLRSDAIFKGRNETAIIDLLENKMTMEGSVWQLPRGWHFVARMPTDGESLGVMTGLNGQAGSPDRLLLRFSPDGTARAESFALLDDRGTGWSVRILPMTGHADIVALSDAA